MFLYRKPICCLLFWNTDDVTYSACGIVFHSFYDKLFEEIVHTVYELSSALYYYITILFLHLFYAL